MSGRFIVIEGPNGVGKTTTAALVAQQLQGRARPVHITTEPTNSSLGRLLRGAEDAFGGRAMALALAADRAHHIEHEIVPHLDAGLDVICDRYLPSSLVLQRIDGVEVDEILTYNQFVLQPDLCVYLEHDPAIIAERLATRLRLSRLEETGGPAAELGLYREAFTALDRQQWHQVRIDCRGANPAAVAAQVVVAIEDRQEAMQ
ncbi:hypothetical protein GCM10027447_27820 [Glycomyces halotolerans]